jgi:hypothetical protein
MSFDTGQIAGVSFPILIFRRLDHRQGMQASIWHDAGEISGSR